MKSLYIKAFLVGPVVGIIAVAIKSPFHIIFAATNLIGVFVNLLFISSIVAIIYALTQWLRKKREVGFKQIGISVGFVVLGVVLTTLATGVAGHIMSNYVDLF